MATVAPPAPPAAPPLRGVQPLRAGQGHSFLWHKLHSLSGIVPIGAFLVEHIVSNYETVNGPLAYAQQVKLLNSLPLVRVLEWTFIFIPLAFHAIYGLFIAFFYIIQHVWRQRFSGISLPEHPGAAFHKVQVELANPWMLAIYVIAMIATTWHFAYGIWLFAAKWGITPGDKARKRLGWVCGLGGAALCLMGLISIWAVVYKYPNAPEDVMPAEPPGVALPAPTTPPPGSVGPQ